jgi:hypothetical protein
MSANTVMNVVVRVGAHVNERGHQFCGHKIKGALKLDHRPEEASRDDAIAGDVRRAHLRQVLDVYTAGEAAPLGDPIHHVGHILGPGWLRPED